MDLRNERETIETEAPVSMKAVTGTCSCVGVDGGHVRCNGM